MSASGHSRRFRHARVTSAYPSIATDARTFRIESFVPTADSTRPFPARKPNENFEKQVGFVC